MLLVGGGWRFLLMSTCAAPNVAAYNGSAGRAGMTTTAVRFFVVLDGGGREGKREESFAAGLWHSTVCSR